MGAYLSNYDAGPEQRTNDWYRARLGKITGSEVGKLLKGGVASSATARSYLYEVAAGRLINPAVRDDDECFAEWLERYKINSRAINWGIENEAGARAAYEKATGTQVVEASSVVHRALPYFASSPDGVVLDGDGEPLIAIEIKCPEGKTCMMYRAEVADASDLKRVNPVYYWQCVSHMAVTGARRCDFVVYDSCSLRPLQIVRVERDEAAIAELEQRVREADEWINRTFGLEDSQESDREQDEQNEVS